MIDNIYFNAVLDFLLLFLLFYLIYTVFLNKKRRTYSQIKKNDEIKYFISRFDLDMKKTKYTSLLRALTLMNSFILAFTSTIVIYIDSIIWSMLISFVIIMIMLYSVYEIVGRSFKRKENK
ncbi:MAG: hypothetical protein GX758_01070 [Tenericutes bacterium]|nr:hypothetical protein [Mycoplasmatota bacterium]